MFSAWLVDGRSHQPFSLGRVEDLERRWLRVQDIQEVARGVSKHDFCLAHPLPVLMAAEVRNGHLIRPVSTGKGQHNPTMVYRTSVGQTLDDEQVEPPIRFMLIRGRVATVDGEPITQWMSVGRTSRSDLMINDYTISKNHARIHISVSGRHAVEDTGSTNGSWLNDRRLSPNEMNPLQNGDTVRFGRQVFTFFYPGSFHDFLVGLT